jgi:hypothetical protein
VCYTSSSGFAGEEMLCGLSRGGWTARTRTQHSTRARHAGDTLVLIACFITRCGGVGISTSSRAQQSRGPSMFFFLIFCIEAGAGQVIDRPAGCCCGWEWDHPGLSVFSREQDRQGQAARTCPPCRARPWHSGMIQQSRSVSFRFVSFLQRSYYTYST